MAESFDKLEDGGLTNRQAIPVTTTIRCTVFHVLQLHGESWALVEHPASTTDYSAWIGKHHAAKLLKQPENLDAERLAYLNQSAAREIKLAQTWINLSHAVTIQSLDISE
jgi:hypothetical protein